MAEMRGYWMNIDRPTRTCRLHVPGCVYELEKQETDSKGVEELKRDGGWHSFASLPDAQSYFRQTWLAEGFSLVGGRECSPPEVST